jgi:hypothetical protein
VPPATLNLVDPCDDEQLDAGDEARLVRRQERDRVGDLGRLSDSAEGDPVGDVPQRDSGLRRNHSIVRPHTRTPRNGADRRNDN